jgi:hypothetical protein
VKVGAEDILVGYRSEDGHTHKATLYRIEPERVIAGMAVREFIWSRGQRHYSGWYWSSTMGRMLAYESRLELARMMLADFDPTVTGIAAQPFLLKGPDGGAVRKAVPDLLLRYADGGFAVVEVKNPQRISRPKVQAQLDWTGQVCALRGWGFEAWCGADARLLANIRFLAGYRRPELIDAEAAADVLTGARKPTAIGSIEQCLTGSCPQALILPAVLHLLWTGRLAADLTGPLGTTTIVRLAEADGA